MRIIKRLSIYFLLFTLAGFTVLEADPKVDSLNAELNKIDEAKKAEIYNQLAEIHWYTAPDKAIEYAEAALELARKYKDKEQEANALINIGNGFLFSGNFREALDKYFVPGLKLAEEIGYDKGIAGGLNSIAASYMNLGDYEEALSTFLRSLEILEANKDHNKAARIKINIASLYINQGIYEKAMDYFFDAMNYFEEAGDIVLLSRTLNNIAVAYHSWGNLDKALEYYNRSLELYIELNDEIGKAIPLNNIGEIYKDKKKYDIALEYYLEALELVKQTNNRQSIGVALQGAGEACKGLEDYDLATDYLIRALDNFTAIGFQEGIANSYFDLGEIHLIRNEEDEAFDYLKKSLELAESSGIKDLMKKNYLLLSNAHQDLGDHQRSLEYFKFYTAIKDSIFTEETSNKLAELDIKYNTARKENEIALLKGENHIQKLYGRLLLVGLLSILIIAIILYYLYRIKTNSNRKLKEANVQIQNQKLKLEVINRELEQLNATKNKFFSIIAHDLKNAFLSLKSGSKLLSKDIETLNNETIVLIARELNFSAENLYRLLQNLLEWARVQTRSIDFFLEKINLKFFLQKNMPILEDIARNKSITINYSHVAESIELLADFNMLNSIFQGLVNNAIKFSHTDSLIEIKADVEGNAAKIRVIDTGVGINKKDIDKLFKIDHHFHTAGTAKEKGTGLGLILCKEFIELHDGEISIESTPDKGTEVTFTIPLLKE